MVDVIRFLLPRQSTPYCTSSDSVAYHTHPIFMSFERWEMQDGAWQGHPAVLSVVSLNSFGSRLQCLQFPCPKAQRCPWELTDLCEVATPELQGFLILESHT